MKTIPSNDEMDFWAYGYNLEKWQDEPPNSGSNQTGWFVYMSNDRRQEIANFLDLKSLYSVGIRKDDGRVFIQTTRALDERNHKVTYVEVAAEFAAEVSKMAYAPIEEPERRKARNEDDVRMDLARRNLL